MVDDAICALVELGPGALMAKFAVKAVYPNIPIQPEDLYLFGIKWRDFFYVNVVNCYHHFAVSKLFHYLDGFFTMYPSTSPTSQSYMNAAVDVLPCLVFLHIQKYEGQSTFLVFHGIGLDSVQQFPRLPHDKAVRFLRRLLGNLVL